MCVVISWKHEECGELSGNTFRKVNSLFFVRTCVEHKILELRKMGKKMKKTRVIISFRPYSIGPNRNLLFQLI